jgi:DNA polymerase-3 subunit delta'
LLLSGPDGIGKRMVALSLAASLLCDQASEGDFCGVCSTCKRVMAGTHPDAQQVKRKEDSRFIVIGDDDDPKAGVIDSIRGLNNMAYKRPFESKLKVFIIEGADWIRHEAQDALLKTLEEPPADTWFFLIASNAANLRETIRSRALVMKFHGLPDDVVRRIVSAKAPKADPVDLELALACADGSPGKALAFMEADGPSELRWLVESLSSDALAAPLQLSDAVMDRIADAAGKVLEAQRERLIFYLGPLQRVLAPVVTDGLPRPDWAAAMPADRMSEIRACILETVRDLRYNVTPKLLTDQLFERIAQHARRERTS